MKTPVNRMTIRQHLTYNWWKYILLAVLSFFLVDLLYTVTAYRSPPEKKVEFYVYGFADQKGLNDYMARVNREQMPDMEVMDSLVMLTDDAYGPMQLTTYMAVGEGDLYLLPREQFLSIASQGGLHPLENEEALLARFTGAGRSLQNGWRKIAETGETHLVGIPQDKVPGLRQLAYAQDGYLCVLAAGGNVDNTLKFLNILVNDMFEAPAEPAAAASVAPDAVTDPAATASPAAPSQP